MSNPSFPNPNVGAGEWSEYAFLILHQLEQLSDGYEALRKDLGELLRQQGLDRKDVSTLASETERRFEEHRRNFEEFREALVARLDDPKKGLDARVKVLEDSNTVANAFKKGRWWVIGGAFTIFTAIIMPTASLLLKG